MIMAKTYERKGSGASSVWDNPGAQLKIAVFRLLCLAVWTGSIIYATWHVFLATEGLDSTKTGLILYDVL
jgi:hypothetical protein